LEDGKKRLQNQVKSAITDVPQRHSPGVLTELAHALRLLAAGRRVEAGQKAATPVCPLWAMADIAEVSLGVNSLKHNPGRHPPLGPTATPLSYCSNGPRLDVAVWAFCISRGFTRLADGWKN